MSTKRTLCRGALIASTILLAALILVASLPALAVASVLARTALLAVAILCLVVGVIAYGASPRFRHWCRSCLDEESQYKGVRLRKDVAISKAHTWVRSRARSATVGADDLVQLALGPVDWLWLPAVGTWVERGDDLIVLGAGERELDLPAPVSGRITCTNDKLRKHPIRLNEDPYGAGWAVVLESEAPLSHAHLHHGIQASAWMRREVDRLIATLQHDDIVLSAAADGGCLLPDLYQSVDEATWQRLQREFFTSNESEARS